MRLIQNSTQSGGARRVSARVFLGLVFLPLLSLGLSGCDTLFGPYENSADAYTVRSIWVRDQDTEGLGYDVTTRDGGYGQNAALFQLVADPSRAEGTTDAFYTAYVSSANFSTVIGPLGNTFAAPPGQVEDLGAAPDGRLNAVVWNEGAWALYTVDPVAESYQILSELPSNVGGPFGIDPSLAISDDGLDIYLTTGSSFAIFRYRMSTPGDTSGVWSLHAGSPGELGEAGEGDGESATEVNLGYTVSPALASDGTLYFLEHYVTRREGGASISWADSLIRAVRPDGTLETVAGAGSAPWALWRGRRWLIKSAESMSALETEALLAVDTDDALYVYNGRRLLNPAGLFRIEPDTRMVSKVAGFGESPGTASWAFGQGRDRVALDDWSTEAGALGANARDVDLDWVFELVSSSWGDIYAVQGGSGILQGIRILEISPPE